jgi:circadian clock protein KaiB
MRANGDSPQVSPDSEPAANGEAEYEFTLFVSGASDLSARAIANARQLFETHVDGRYRLAVVDIYEDPAALLSHQVLAIPTLIKHRPAPMRRLVGDLSRSQEVLLALGLAAADDARHVGR